MSNLRDTGERYNTIRENIIKILIDYDKYVMDTHHAVIQIADIMTKGTPLEVRKRKPDEPLEYYRYMTSPIFRRTVESITSYIMSNTKDNE